MRKALLLWLILCVPVCGQQPVKAPQRVDVEIGWPGTVEVSNPDKLPLLIVNPFESKLQFRREFTDDPLVMRYFAFGREAGEFTLFMVGSKDNRPVIVGQITVVVGGGKPNPDPKPDPQPGPAPTKQGYFIIVVEETAQAAANRGANFVDATLRQRIQDKGHKWLVFDKDVVDKDGVRPRDLVFYLDKAAGKTLPRMFLVGLSDSKIHFEGDAPKTAAELVKLLESKGG